MHRLWPLLSVALGIASLSVPALRADAPDRVKLVDVTAAEPGATPTAGSSRQGIGINPGPPNLLFQGYQLAANYMRLNNQGLGRALNARERAAIFPLFSAYNPVSGNQPSPQNLIDRVRLRWNSLMFDQLILGLGRPFPTDIEAMTFLYGGPGPVPGIPYYQVYLEGGDPGILDQAKFRLIVHEMVHCRQIHQAGNTDLAFGNQYMNAYQAAGFSYDGNALEVQAYAFAASSATTARWAYYCSHPHGVGGVRD
jgi:hypothetical protein